MLNLNYRAVVAAAVAAILIGALWYSPLLFGNEYMVVRGANPSAAAGQSISSAEILSDVAKNAVVAFVLSRVVVRLGVVGWKDAVHLALWVRGGFQAMLLMGSVLHEKMPWTIYAFHAGDALVKTVVTSVILAV